MNPQRQQDEPEHEPDTATNADCYVASSKSARQADSDREHQTPSRRAPPPDFGFAGILYGLLFSLMFWAAALWLWWVW